MKHLPSHAALVQWTFCRGAAMVICQVTALGSHRFTVSVVPVGSSEVSRGETFTSAVTALHRHAFVAASLREAGWTLVSYSRPQGQTRRAYAA